MSKYRKAPRRLDYQLFDACDLSDRRGWREKDRRFARIGDRATRNGHKVWRRTNSSRPGEWMTRLLGTTKCIEVDVVRSGATAILNCLLWLSALGRNPTMPGIASLIISTILDVRVNPRPFTIIVSPDRPMFDMFAAFFGFTTEVIVNLTRSPAPDFTSS